jgi:hypothetical protein
MKRHFGWFAVLLGACTNKHLDMGSQQDGGHGLSGKPGPTSESCENGPQLPILGVWEGYVENYSFLSGSDAVRLHITNANDTLVCGTVVLGDPTTPPPLTDPHTAYPPGRFDPPHLIDAWDSTGLLLVYAEGFVLPIANSKVTGSRVQFGANWLQPWEPWCAQQTPVAQPAPPGVPPTEYTCNGAGDPACSHKGAHCGTNMLCSGICSCTAQQCTASGLSHRPECKWLNFDLQVRGSDVSGSVKRACAGVNNVHFARVR